MKVFSLSKVRVLCRKRYWCLVFPRREDLEMIRSIMGNLLIVWTHVLSRLRPREQGSALDPRSSFQIGCREIWRKTLRQDHILIICWEIVGKDQLLAYLINTIKKLWFLNRRMQTFIQHEVIIQTFRAITSSRHKMIYFYHISKLFQTDILYTKYILYFQPQSN